MSGFFAFYVISMIGALILLEKEFKDPLFQKAIKTLIKLENFTKHNPRKKKEKAEPNLAFAFAILALIPILNTIICVSIMSKYKLK